MYFFIVLLNIFFLSSCVSTPELPSGGPVAKIKREVRCSDDCEMVKKEN